MDIFNLVISLVSGAVGGNVAGNALKEKSLGTVGNTVSGIVGGGIGNYILQALGLLASAGMATAATGDASTGVDIGALIANIGGSGVGGALLTVIIGLIKNAAK
jgi:uncharacterized membrane protein YeaQ/YmgE (transglycosylase-associated protein family)